MKHMCRNILCFLIFITTGSSMSGQHQKIWNWVNQLGSNSWDRVSGIACDDKSNLYVAGNFSGTMVCNHLKVKAAGNRDVFVVAFNEKGNIKSLVTPDDARINQVNCMISTSDNQLILGGMSREPDSISDNDSDDRLCIVKTSARGKVQWMTTLIPDAGASLFLLEADEHFIFAAGFFQGTLSVQDTVIRSQGGKDIFIIKLNQTGELQKIISVGSQEDDIPSSMTVTPSGAVYLSGTYGKSFYWDDLYLTSATGKTHGFIASLNNELKACRKKEIHGDDYLDIASITSDTASNIIAAGSFNLNLYLEDSTMTSRGYSDCFIAKYHPDGEKIWSRSLGTWYYDHTNKIITDNLGGIILTGSIGDTLVADSIYLPAQSRNTAVAMQFTASGSVVWGDCISGEGSYFGKEVMLDKKGNLYFAGGFSRVFKKENESLVSKGDQDVFFARYFNCDWSNVDIIGEPYICEGSAVELSVSQGYTNIIWNDSITGRFYTAHKPGRYTVSMLDKKGCLLSDTLNLLPAQSPDFSLGKDQHIALENTLILKAPEHFTHFEWPDFSDKSTYVAKASNGIPGKYDFWLSARDSFGCPARDTITVTFYPKTDWIDPDAIVLSYYPNPIKERVYWSINTPNPCKLMVNITGADGSPVWNEYIPYYEPETEMQINFSDYPTGVYYMQVQNATGQGSKTICIIKQ